jgi:hypothetical protein
VSKSWKCECWKSGETGQNFSRRENSSPFPQQFQHPTTDSTTSIRLSASQYSCVLLHGVTLLLLLNVYQGALRTPDALKACKHFGIPQEYNQSIQQNRTGRCGYGWAGARIAAEAVEGTHIAYKQNLGCHLNSISLHPRHMISHSACQAVQLIGISRRLTTGLASNNRISSSSSSSSGSSS